MRLYGSVTNRILEHGLDVTPKVGQDVTMYYWSDRRSTTVETVNAKGTRVTLECGYTATKRKNGIWRLVGESMNGGTGIRFGVKDDYTDPHF
jgi:hypothetical protein